MRSSSVVFVLLTSVIFCDSSFSGIILPSDFSGVQGAKGIYYESIGDSRSSNTQNPGQGISLMTFKEAFNHGYGGPLVPAYIHSATDSFPFVAFDGGVDYLSLHPGTGGYNHGTGTSNIGVSIRFKASVDGLYRLNGAFAPQNPYWGSGNGVDVLVAKGNDLDNPLFATTIANTHAVDPSDLFGGTGMTPFDLSVQLLAGESVRFIVFADGQGQDGTYDGTAFRVAISQVPEPSSATLLLGGFGLMWFFLRRSRRTLPSPKRQCVPS